MRSVACSLALVALSCAAPIAPSDGQDDDVPLPARSSTGGGSGGGQGSGGKGGGSTTDSAPLPTPPPSSGSPSPPSVCSTTAARYCVDFETAMTTDWSSFAYAGTAPMMVSDIKAPSPKLALETTVPPNLGAWVQVGRLVGVAGNLLKIELDLNVAAHSAVPDDGFVAPLEIRTPATASNANGTQIAAYYLTKNGEGIYVSPGDDEDGIFKGNLYKPTTLLPTTWTHVVLEILFDKSKGHVTLSFNGKVVVDKQNISTSSTSGVPGGAVTVYFGIYQFTNAESANGLPGLQARYDNVQIF